jgi:hypothetical protein
MTTKNPTDSSANRFKTFGSSPTNNSSHDSFDDSFDEPANPFRRRRRNESNESNESNEPVKPASRWSNLKLDEDENPRSPRNSFQKRSGDFGPDKDKYGNYRKPTFRRSTRPKTPPPPTFCLEKSLPTDFPALG